MTPTQYEALVRDYPEFKLREMVTIFGKAAAWPGMGHYAADDYWTHVVNNSPDEFIGWVCQEILLHDAR